MGLFGFMPAKFGRQSKPRVLDMQDAPMPSTRRTTGRVDQKRAHQQSVAGGQGAKELRLLVVKRLNPLGRKAAQASSLAAHRLPNSPCPVSRINSRLPRMQDDKNGPEQRPEADCN